MAQQLNKEALRARRETLVSALKRYESGELAHYEEDEHGEVEATDEHVRALKARIAEIDRELAGA